MLVKNELRSAAKALRKQITPARRHNAAEKAFLSLLPLLGPISHVLSFASFGEEIDLWPLNRELKQKLCLPHHSGEIYKASLSQLHPSSLGVLEPIPAFSEAISIDNIDCVLVPALLFDEDGYRIGYGGGFYDKLLSKIKKETKIWGVGFLEQLSITPLPREPHDLPVSQLFLF